MQHVTEKIDIWHRDCTSLICVCVNISVFLNINKYSSAHVYLLSDSRRERQRGRGFKAVDSVSASGELIMIIVDLISSCLHGTVNFMLLTQIKK